MKINIESSEKNTYVMAVKTLPASLCNITFSSCEPKKFPKLAVYNYPKYSNLNIFQMLNLRPDFNYFIDQDIQENLSLSEYVQQKHVQDDYYHKLYFSLKGKTACMANTHPHNDYVYKNEVKQCLQYITDNIVELFITYKKFITDLETTYFDNYSGNVFKQVYKHLRPSINTLYANTKLSHLKKISLKMGLDLEKYTEVRSNVPPFIPAGYYYSNQVFINTHQWQGYLKNGKAWALKGYSSIYFHELAHGIDFKYNNIQLWKNNKNNSNGQLSYDIKFLKHVKKSYKNKHKVKTKQNGYLSYYMCPSVQIKNKKVSYKWNRASEEAFAESFSCLCDWLLNGFKKIDNLILTGNVHKRYIVIKTLVPTMRYLMKNLDWETIGVPTTLIQKRKKLIYNYLEIIDNMSYKPRNTEIRMIRNNNIKKLNLQSLIKINKQTLKN